MPFDTTLKQLCVILRLNRKHTDTPCVRIDCIIHSYGREYLGDPQTHTKQWSDSKSQYTCNKKHCDKSEPS